MTAQALTGLKGWLRENKDRIGRVVDFDPAADKLCPLNFTAGNTGLTNEILDNVTLFSDWVSNSLKDAGCRYGIGGYAEHRTIYSRSAHFDAGDEPRRLHLGTDIWAGAGTPVYNFYEGKVHSFHYNDRFGDYGATIIMEYDLGGLVIHALYGHLSLPSLNGLAEGMVMPAGGPFAFLGAPAENGHWPPHLHFQLILDMQGKKGDYPGVCQFSQREAFLSNCPDPAIILEYTLPYPSNIS